MKNGYTQVCRIPGHHSWQELNELIKAEIGLDLDMFETEADYQQALREGFVELDGADTIIWADEGI